MSQPKPPLPAALRCEIRVQGVAREQEAAAFAAELLLAHAPDRHQHGSGQAQPACRTQPQHQPGSGADRWKRSEQVGPERLPQILQLRPRGAVAGGEHVRRRPSIPGHG